MSKPIIPVMLAMLSLSVFLLPVYGQEQLSHPSRSSQTIYFHFDRTDIDSTYAGNQEVLNTMHALFTDAFRISFIDSIQVYAFSSPEGREAYNFRLSQQRAASMQKYLTSHYPLLSAVPLSLTSGGENWEGLRALVSADPDFNEREEVLMILDEVSDLTKRERLLKRLNIGNAYKYMQQHIFPLLRNSMVCTIWMNNRLKSSVLSSRQVKPAGAVAAWSSAYASAVLPVVDSSISSLSPFPIKTGSERYSALKTNLAAWGITTVNLAYEVQVGTRFSLDLPLMWSSWDLARPHALRIVLFQPELRYWLSQPGRGHFFGLHLHVARYNLKWEEYRYQDTDYPLWGTGLSYGYALPLTDRWGMEFNLGAGYANSRYNTYYNVTNGPLLNTRLLHYWGITRLGLSFVYKLSKP